MMHAVREALDQRDLLLYVVDATTPFSGRRPTRAWTCCKKAETPVLLVLNKIDVLKDKGGLLPLIEEYRKLHEFADYVPVSAKTGDGLDELRKRDHRAACRRAGVFSGGSHDRSAGAFSGGRVDSRKGARGDAPGGSALCRRDDRQVGRGRPTLTRIFATIFVERDGQKGIVIGAKGAMLKQIGTLARERDGALLGRQDFSRSARKGAARLAREQGLPQRARLAYNGRRR